MHDRAELLEAALDLMDQGVAVLDERSNVLFWNKAAESLTGYRGADLLSRRCPRELYQVDQAHTDAANEGRAHGHEEAGHTGFAGAIAGYGHGGLRGKAATADDDFIQRPALVAMRHRMGHTVPAMLRKLPLRNSLGARVGAALLFHSVEELDTLPHGECGEGVGVERGQAELEDRLDAAHEQWKANNVPFGLVWITVDQAAMLRKTHGREPCEAMLRIVEQTLVRGLRPGEVLGRWGNDEFLVLSHERTAALLLDHAHRLAGLARTAEFRWWGDRVNLTVSIGASQAHEADTLQRLLQRAQESMQASLHAGGNHVTEAKGE
jgi:diguanylate cyclase (GGDEF)-like protein